MYGFILSLQGLNAELLQNHNTKERMGKVDEKLHKFLSYCHLPSIRTDHMYQQFFRKYPEGNQTASSSSIYSHVTDFFDDGLKMVLELQVHTSFYDIFCTICLMSIFCTIKLC